jgi:hypothetical protein
MIRIGEAIIDESIVTEQFACDVQRCKGACCTLEGGRGAPLDDGELGEMTHALPHAKEYLSEKHLQFIETQGFYEGNKGSYTTKCIENRACVFVFYENGVARCSFEKAFLDGKSSWRKPISCHLYPIRVSSYDRRTLNYHQIDECKPARERGDVEQITVLEFLENPLIRKYGEAWYRELRGKTIDGKSVIGDGIVD